jgi:hypothetical protein
MSTDQNDTTIGEQKCHHMGELLPAFIENEKDTTDILPARSCPPLPHREERE